jgi:hypothetical protein
MRMSSVLENCMEAEAKSIPPQTVIDENPQAILFRAAPAATGVRQSQSLRFREACNQQTDLVPFRLPRYRRGRLLTLVVSLLVALSAQARSVISAWQLAESRGGFTENRAERDTHAIQVAVIGTNNNAIQYRADTLNITN